MGDYYIVPLWKDTNDSQGRAGIDMTAWLGTGRMFAGLIWIV